VFPHLHCYSRTFGAYHSLFFFLFRICADFTIDFRLFLPRSFYSRLLPGIISPYVSLRMRRRWFESPSIAQIFSRILQHLKVSPDLLSRAVLVPKNSWPIPAPAHRGSGVSTSSPRQAEVFHLFFRAQARFSFSPTLTVSVIVFLAPVGKLLEV